MLITFIVTSSLFIFRKILMLTWQSKAPFLPSSSYISCCTNHALSLKTQTTAPSVVTFLTGCIIGVLSVLSHPSLDFGTCQREGQRKRGVRFSMNTIKALYIKPPQAPQIGPSFESQTFQSPPNLLQAPSDLKIMLVEVLENTNRPLEHWVTASQFSVSLWGFLISRRSHG